jgi:hypothetical protein
MSSSSGAAEQLTTSRERPLSRIVDVVETGGGVVVVVVVVDVESTNGPGTHAAAATARATIIKIVRLLSLIGCLTRLGTTLRRF